MKKVSIIIPCYQNEGSIPILAERLIGLKQKLSDKIVFSYILVNDGSSDNTHHELLDFKNRLPDQVRIVKLARNFGSYNAFLAGMTYSSGDCHVYLHADLQDPPELIEEMFDYFVKGNKLVIAYRQNREDGNLFSSFYHKLVKRFAIRNIPSGGFDLILFDEQIRKEVVEISEKNTNIVYLVSWLGYPYMAIPYTRVKREHGKSQWLFHKKVKLFVDTFFSFSDLPIQLLRIVCVLLVIASLAMGIYWAVAGEGDLFSPRRLFGFMVTLGAICLSVVIFILSEYIIRIHETVRNRPSFVVDEII